MNESKRLVIDGDVGQGLREVGAQLAVNRGGLFIGRGPGGFALVAGAVGDGVQLAANGAMVAVSLSPAGLRGLIDRGLTLLGEDPSSPPLPKGLVIQ